ncbi:MAG: thioredoxin family protein [Candidatus Latescibacterota bacterium]
MAILSEKVREGVEKEFERLEQKVQLIVFTQEMECTYCSENRMLAQEVASLGDKISLTVYDFSKNREQAQQYHVDKIPATVVMGEKDYGIKFYGFPGGYEFTSLTEAIHLVSSRDSRLKSQSRELLKKLTHPIHIQTFITLTCPYCPPAVKLSHQFALESDLVCADMVESAEFPQLAHKYNVFSVPKVVINEETEFEGALGEAEFVAKVWEAETRKG